MRTLQFLALGTLLICVTTAQAQDVSGISNRIKWATASEVDNFGYDVFRGDSETGQFVKINQNTIPGAGNSDTPSRYEYTDSAIAEGKTYWYYVESISMTGQREKFTPTFQSKPKYPEPED